MLKAIKLIREIVIYLGSFLCVITLVMEKQVKHFLIILGCMAVVAIVLDILKAFLVSKEN